MTPAQLIDRIATARRIRQSQLDAAARRPTSAETRAGLAHVPGDRVLDSITGQEGEVLGGTSQNVVVPTAK